MLRTKKLYNKLKVKKNKSKKLVELRLSELTESLA